MCAYLFVHFIGEEIDGEQIYFSVSEDGLYWKYLHKGQPVLKSLTGDEGVRDPFMVKNEKSGTYYLIATDLRVGKIHDWTKAQEQGSRPIVEAIDTETQAMVKLGSGANLLGYYMYHSGMNPERK